MVFKAELTVLWLSLVTLMQLSSVAATFDYWKELVTLPGTSSLSLTAEIYIEHSLNIEAGLEEFLSSLKQSKKFSGQRITTEKHACETLVYSFPHNNNPKLYVFPSPDIQFATLIECSQQVDIRLLAVNPKMFAGLNVDERWTYLLMGFNQDFGTVKVYVGSYCGDSSNFSLRSLGCDRRIRKLTETNYYLAKRNGKTLEALVNYTQEAVSGDKKLAMIRDFRDYVDENELDEDELDQLTEAAANLMEFSELTDQEYTTLFTYLYKNSSKTENLTISDSTIINILNQAALYLDHFGFSDDSLLTVDEIIPVMFQQYTVLTESGAAITKSSSISTVKTLKIIQFVFTGGDISSSSLTEISISMGQQSIFGTTDKGNCIMLYTNTSTKDQIFAFHIYSGISSTEIPILGRLFYFNIELADPGYNSVYSVICELHKCKPVSMSNEKINLYAASSGIYKVTDNYCEDSEKNQDLLDAYEQFKGTSSISNAIINYLLGDELDKCLVKYMWNDYKEYFNTGIGDYYTFEYLLEISMLALDSSVHPYLTTGIVYDMLGEAWLTNEFIPSTMDSSLLQSAIELSALYIEYFNGTVLSIRNADNEISRFMAYYSNFTLSLGQYPLNYTSSYQDSTIISLRKAKITKTDFNSATPDYNPNSNIVLSGTWPLGDSDILSILFINVSSTHSKTDMVGFHLYYSGYTYSNGKYEIVEYIDKEITSSVVTLTAYVSINDGSQFECLDDSCTVIAVDASTLRYSTNEQGVTITIFKCVGKQEYNYDSGECEKDCDGTCATCNTDNECESCATGFTNSSTKCYYSTLDNCSVLENDETCAECESYYALNSSYECQVCEDDGVFYNSSTGPCANCHETCKTCNETSDHCTSCGFLHQLTQNNTCECVSNSSESGPDCVCNINYGVNNESCVSCNDSYCYNCSDDYSVCNECIQKYYLDSICMKCNDTCANCTNSTTCTSCVDNAELVEENCVCINNSEYSSNSDSCECSTGYYLNTDDSPAVCSECNDTCYNCTNITTCLSCVENADLVDDSCICISHSEYNSDSDSCECSTGYYLNTDDSPAICVKCNDTCLNCTNSTTCLSCIENADLVDGSCECHTGYFLNSDVSPAICEKCSDACNNCTNNTTCLSCIQNANLTNDGSCECLTGYFFNTNDTSAICSECNDTCYNCTNNTHCSYCVENADLIDNTCICMNHSEYSSASDSCECQAGYFLNTDVSPAICEKCSDACYNCTNSTTCLSCIENASLTNDGSCECQVGYFFNTIDSQVICSACNDTCYNCTNSTHCLHCVENADLVDDSCICINYSEYNLDSDSCECQTGYRLYNETSPSMCIGCSEACLNCTNTTCLSCIENANLTNDGICECNTGYFLNTDESPAICSECSDTCYNCTNSTYCLHCVQNADLVDNTCICINHSEYNSASDSCECHTGYFFNTDESPAICSECSDACYNCTNSTHCLYCVENAVLIDNTCECIDNSEYSSESDSCECISRYYLKTDETADICKKCKNTCLNCTNSTNCESCVENAVLIDNTCECIDNSEYSSESDSCECKSGYFLNTENSPHTCDGCKSYLVQDDILSAYYSSDFKYFYINFAIEIQDISKCSQAVNDTSILGKKAKCSRSSSKKAIEIKLGSNWTPITSTLTLNEYELLKYGSSYCSIEPESSLYVQVNLTSLVYFTSGSIIGRTDIYLGCSDSDEIDYKAKGLTDLTGLGVEASWQATSSNSTIQETLNNQLKDSTSSLTYLDYYVSNFSGFSGNATIYYTVKNKFNESVTVTLTIFIYQSKSIAIEIEGGNTFSVYNDKDLIFSVNVLDNCGQTSNMKFNWVFVSGPEKLSDAKKNSLSIEQNKLLPNSTYVFNVTAKSGSVSSNTDVLTINVLIRELVIDWKTPATYNPDDGDLVVDASESYDPNYKEKVSLSFVWTCVGGSKACSSELKKSFSDTDSSKLSIKSTLLEGYSYINIRVTVSSSLTSNTGTVRVNITDQVPTVTISVPTERQALSKYIYISGSTSAKKGDLDYYWTVQDSNNTKMTYNYLFLLIYPYTFIAGGTYSLTLKVTVSASSYEILYSDEILINNPPSCSELTITPQSGYAYYDNFDIYSVCSDKEEDYPLYSKVSYFDNDSKNKRKYVIKYGNGYERVKTKLSSGNLTVLFEICDTFDDCYEYNNTIIVTAKKDKRMLAEAAYVSDYRTLISEYPNEMPGLCNILASSYELSESFWNEVMDDLGIYINSFDTYSAVILNSAAGCLAAMINSKQTALLIDDYLKVFNMSITVLSKYQDYDNSSSTLAQFDNESLDYFLDIAYVFMALAANTEVNSTYYDTTNIAIKYQTIAFAKQFYKKTTGYKFELDGNEISVYRGIIDTSSVQNISFNNVTFDVSSFNATDSQQLGLLLTIFSDLGNFSNYTNGYEIRLSNDGYLENNDFSFPTNISYITQFDPPIQFQIPTFTELTTDYRCGTLMENDQVNFTGCEIVEAGIDNVTLSISHTSLFVIVEPEIMIVTPTASCEVNYAPIIIMAIVGFIIVILMPIMILLDNNETISLEENLNSDQGVSKTIEYSPNSPSSYTERPLNSISDLSIPEPEDISESIIENPNAADYTIEFKLRSIDSPEKPEKKPKSCFSRMIEGHLLFGIYVYRPVFIRILRVLVLGSTLILQLFLIGIFLFYKYDTDDYVSSSEVSTQNLFDDYTDKYFGYFVVALAIAIGYEVSLIVLFSQTWNLIALRTVGLILLVVVTGGSIAGIIILTLDFCFEWSGYWAVSFLWSILLEIFCLQFIYMFIRYPLRKEKA